MIRHPRLKDSDGNEYDGIRRPERPNPDYFLLYEIEEDIASRSRGFVFHTIAELVYGNPSYWFIIYDVNRSKHPVEFVTGDIIYIPLQIEQLTRRRSSPTGRIS